LKSNAASDWLWSSQEERDMNQQARAYDIDGVTCEGVLLHDADA
jgi:hypothetical protein